MSGRGPRWIGGPKFPGYSISLSGKFDEVYGYAEIDGTKYVDATELTITKWKTVKLHVSATLESLNDQCQVTLNGTVVLSGAGDYELFVTAPAAIVFARKIHSTGKYHWECAITTE